MSASEKAVLRTEALARRAAVPEAVRAAFATRLSTLGPALVRSEADPTADPVVAAFLPIRGEPDTLPLITVLNRVGLVTVLPVAGSPKDPLVFRRWRPGEALEDGRWGLRHPPAAAPAIAPDTLFVPVAAFDRRGTRIGYGAGYYDRSLAALRRRKPVRAIGVAFACQEVLFIPAEPHDAPLDLVMTERDVILCEV